MLEIRRVKEHEVNQALRLLFSQGHSDGAQLDNKVAAFKDLSQREEYDLTRQMVAVAGDQLLFACLFTPHQGGTAFIFISNPDNLADSDKAAAVQALKQLRQWAVEGRFNLLQVLLEPGDASRRGICLGGGFKKLTELIYLYGITDMCPPEGPSPEGISWLTYDPQQHERFKSVIAQTYQNSRDCPELENLRTMEETMASHRAAGQFVPGLWKILLLHQEPAGVLLLTPLPVSDTMELSYMGLIPPQRGKGLGKVLLTQALSCAGKCSSPSLTLAVDVRNLSARQLYGHFGFQELFRRTVMYYSTRWT